VCTIGAEAEVSSANSTPHLTNETFKRKRFAPGVCTSAQECARAPRSVHERPGGALRLGRTLSSHTSSESPRHVKRMGRAGVGSTATDALVKRISGAAPPQPPNEQLPRRVFDFVGATVGRSVASAITSTADAAAAAATHSKNAVGCCSGLGRRSRGNPRACKNIRVRCWVSIVALTLRHEGM
jgi:hypothetical protein